MTNEATEMNTAALRVSALASIEYDERLVEDADVLFDSQRFPSAYVLPLNVRNDHPRVTFDGIRHRDGVA